MEGHIFPNLFRKLVLIFYFKQSTKLHDSAYQDYGTYLDCFSLRGEDGQNGLIVLLVKLDHLDVVEHVEQMGLYRMRVAGLAQDLQQCRVGHEEKARKQQTLLFQVSIKINKVNT